MSCGSIGALVSLTQSSVGDKRTAHKFFDSEPDLASEVLSMMVAE